MLFRVLWATPYKLVPTTQTSNTEMQTLIKINSGFYKQY